MLAKKPKGTVQKRQGSSITGLLWMFVGAILTVMCLGVLYLWNPFDIGSETKTEERTVEPITQKSTDTQDFEFYDLLPDQEIMGVPDEDILSQSSQSTATGEPDVIVSEKKDNSSNNNTANYGISENTILNPEDSSSASAARGEQEIVIIEEEGTYDEPSDTPINNQNNRNQSGSTPSSNSQSNRSASGTPQTATNASSNRPSYILQINSFSSAEQADKRRAQVLLAGVEARVVKSKQANGDMFYQVVTSPMKNRQDVLTTQQKLQNSGIDSIIVEQRR